VAITAAAGSAKVPAVLAVGNFPIVTTGTTAEYRVVIHAQQRSPAEAAVARLAAVAGADVTAVLVVGNFPVVATETVLGYAAMVKHGAGPGKAAMTEVAVVSAFDMPRVLAARGYAVVATLAGTDHGNVIDLDDVLPVSRPVAVFTVTGDPDMVAGHGTRLYSPGIRMTLIAATRRTGKHALQVAAFTFQRAVFEVQREAGFVVTEISAKTLRRASTCEQQAD